MLNVSLGSAAAVAKMEGVSPATREFAYEKEKDPLYGAYATRFTSARGEPPPLPAVLVAARHTDFSAAPDTSLVSAIKTEARAEVRGPVLTGPVVPAGDQVRQSPRTEAAVSAQGQTTHLDFAARPPTPLVGRLQAWRESMLAEKAKLAEPLEVSATVKQEDRHAYRASRSADPSP